MKAHPIRDEIFNFLEENRHLTRKSGTIIEYKQYSIFISNKDMQKPRLSIFFDISEMQQFPRFFLITRTASRPSTMYSIHRNYDKELTRQVPAGLDISEAMVYIILMKVLNIDIDLQKIPYRLRNITNKYYGTRTP